MGLIFDRKKHRNRAVYDPDEFVDTRPSPLLTRGFSKGSSSHGYCNEGFRQATINQPLRMGKLSAMRR